MEKAIKKAIEGGWNPKTTIYSLDSIKGYFEDIMEDCNSMRNNIGTYNPKLLGMTEGIFSVAGQGIEASKYREWMLFTSDPLFWQVLGKVEGWKGTGIFKSCLCHENKNEELMEWQLKWHDFIDHLAQGKDVNSFFEELLK